MKKKSLGFVICCLALSIVFTSCDNSHQVRLKNGAVVAVNDGWDRNYKSGDTVCVVRTLRGNAVVGDWYVDNSGQMCDSNYTNTLGYDKMLRIGVIAH